MGYPTLMASRPICFVFNISALEASWLNDMVTLQMNPMMQSLAQNLTTAGIPVTFSNLIGDFEGKGICGSPESIHGIVGTTTAGDKPQTLGLPPSAQSFHPNLGGTTLYSTSANRTLRLMGK